MMENAETKSFFPWKKKAILRGEELRKLRKRFKEMEESRDSSHLRLGRSKRDTIG